MKEEPLRGHWSTGHRTHSARAAATSSAVLCGGKTGLYGRTLSSVPLIQLGVTSPSYPISYCIHKVIELALRYLYKKRREKINDLCFCCRAEHQLWCLCSVKKTKPASKSQSIRNVLFHFHLVGNLSFSAWSTSTEFKPTITIHSSSSSSSLSNGFSFCLLDRDIKYRQIPWNGLIIYALQSEQLHVKWLYIVYVYY